MRENTTQNRTPPRTSEGPPPTNLADELGSLDDSHDDSIIEPTSDSQLRRLEVELNSQKDQNKALTLYINKIIERLLQHQGFESILSNAQEGPHGRPNGDLNTGKNLLPPPPVKEKSPLPPAKENAPPAPSFLQRAKSMTRGRPMSIMGPPPTSQPSVNEDPDTAPRVPIGRSQNKRMSTSAHRRTPSADTSSAATIISNMYRPSDAPLSPSIVSPRNSFFPGMGSRIPSGQSIPEAHDEDEPNAVGGAPDSAARNAALDALTGSADTRTSSGKEISVDMPSPPRSQTSSSNNREGNAMFEGRKMRPLRLVQENEEAEHARKANNRQSWFGGLFGGVDRGKGMPGGEQ
ncbi:hypothetical protein LTS18_008393 [Coniosporium uncinatum]|uniref:Uncharacterized protein n=1 Tax=Coniosporium uncinatum TaxID=93489 RepID=A0ACC3D1W3_9PEZI|nr:hypothetical protein LTS18_008393 [Coniosporium uncinatum]